jgi:hypothetical protein
MPIIFVFHLRKTPSPITLYSELLTNTTICPFVSRLCYITCDSALLDLGPIPVYFVASATVDCLSLIRMRGHRFLILFLVLWVFNHVRRNAMFLPLRVRHFSPRKNAARVAHRTSTLLSSQSSFNRRSIRASISFAFSTATSISRNTSSWSKGTPPFFCSTHSSLCAFRAMDNVPCARVSSNRTGSRMAKV